MLWGVSHAMLYTFYACKPDGDALTFEALELPGDTEAVARAERVLAEHASCAYVEVWEEGRQVATARRACRAG